MADKDYLEKNRGYVTASKLKMYLRNPEEYKLLYVDEFTLEDEETSDSLKIGTAFDFLMTYGKKKFLETYFLDDGYTIAELAERLAFLDCPTKDGYSRDRVGMPDYSMVEDTEERLARVAAYSKCKKNELVQKFYGDTDGKIRLTAGQSSRVFGMYAESLRQPAFDLASPYDVQVEIKCEFEGMPIKGTLDRLAFFDRDQKRYSADQVLEMKSKSEDRKKEVESMGMYGLIRDWKTSGRINRFEYDMENTFDYVTSMAFYYILVRVQFGVQSNVRLDVVESVPNHLSIPYRLEAKKLYKRSVESIQPGLKALIRSYAQDERLPVKPLTGEPVTIREMSQSKYYQYLPSAIREDAVEPNVGIQDQY